MLRIEPGTRDNQFLMECVSQSDSLVAFFRLDLCSVCISHRLTSWDETMYKGSVISTCWPASESSIKGFIHRRFSFLVDSLKMGQTQTMIAEIEIQAPPETVRSVVSQNTISLTSTMLSRLVHGLFKI